VTGFLLDTNILSELRRAEPEPRVVDFVAGQLLDQLFVSAVTFAEIRFGIERVNDVGKRAELQDWLKHRVRPMFEDRVLPVSEDIMFKWRLLVEEGRKAGHTFSQPDLIIAATALHHGLTVVSRDTKDYRRARVPVLDPWKEAIPSDAGRASRAQDM
jgi:predicted nucleic acid-binding protein